MMLYQQRPTGSTVHMRWLCEAGPLVRIGRLVGPAALQPDGLGRLDVAGLNDLESKHLEGIWKSSPQH